MPYLTSIERACKDEEWKEEWKARWKTGWKKGWKEGWEEGVVKMLRKTIDLLLSVRGATGQPLRDRVRDLSDPHLLEQIHNGLIFGQSLEEVERLLP